MVDDLRHFPLVLNDEWYPVFACIFEIFVLFLFKNTFCKFYQMLYIYVGLLEKNKTKKKYEGCLEANWS